MANCSRVAVILGGILFTLFLAACSASGGEETVGSVFSNKAEPSTSSSSDKASVSNPTSSNQSTTKSSNSQADISSSQSTETQSSDGGSIKPTVTCPSSHPVLDWSGDCHACDDETGFTPEVREDCERLCNGQNGTTKRVYDFHCMLEKCPDSKPLKDTWGDCRSCKYDGPVRDTENCSKCSNRKVQNGYCVIANCEGRPLLDNDGFCYPCSTSLSVQTVKGECTSKCPNRRESGSWSWGSGADKVEGTWCDYNSEGSE